MEAVWPSASASGNLITNGDIFMKICTHVP